MMRREPNYVLPPNPSKSELLGVHNHLSQQKIVDKDGIALLEMAYPFLKSEADDNQFCTNGAVD
jgi:hypothetical protein